MGIKEFFQTIQWGATLQVAAIRIAIASILWPLLLIFLGNSKAAEFFPLVFGFILVLAAFIAIAIPAVGLARANVPYVGLAALPAWMVVVADPLVKMLHSKRPDLVPVDEFKLINPPVLAIFQNGEQYDGDADMSEGLQSSYEPIEANAKQDESAPAATFDQNPEDFDSETFISFVKVLEKQLNVPRVFMLTLATNLFAGKAEEIEKEAASLINRLTSVLPPFETIGSEDDDKEVLNWNQLLTDEAQALIDAGGDAFQESHLFIDLQVANRLRTPGGAPLRSVLEACKFSRDEPYAD